MRFLFTIEAKRIPQTNHKPARWRFRLLRMKRNGRVATRIVSIPVELHDELTYSWQVLKEALGEPESWSFGADGTVLFHYHGGTSWVEALQFFKVIK